MSNWRAPLLPMLEQVSGAVGVAVVAAPGAPPETLWRNAPAEQEPAFLVYSITKSFTAALVLALEREGRLALEDPLAHWLPAVPEAGRITLRQLLAHTAGIPDYGGLRAYHEAVRASPASPWPLERFAAETYEHGLGFAPGTGWAYSNPGYLLLKRVAEAAALERYAELIASRIARPLELSRTFVAETPGDLAALAPATSRALAPDGAPREVRGHYHPGWVAHGVVASTPSEVARFFDALFGGRLLPRSSLSRMTALAPVPAPPPPRWREPSYGLGLMGDPASPWGVLWGHNGGGPGYGASAFHAAQLGVTVCALGALEGSSVSAEALVFAALDALER